MTHAEIRQAVDAVLARPVFDLEEVERYRWDFQWFWTLLDWILSPLFRFLEGLGDMPGWVQTVVYAALTIVLFGLIAHLVYTVLVAFRRDRFELPSLEAVTPVTVEDLAQSAQQYAERGDYVDASRALYRATLLALEEKRKGRLRKGLTNTEYLHTFHAPWVVENLRVFVDLINWKWYRDNRFDRADYEACRAAYDRISTRLHEEFE